MKNTAVVQVLWNSRFHLVHCLQVWVELLEDEPHHLHITFQATGMKDSLSSLHQIQDSMTSLQFKHF